MTCSNEKDETLDGGSPFRLRQCVNGRAPKNVRSAINLRKFHRIPRPLIVHRIAPMHLNVRKNQFMREASDTYGAPLPRCKYYL